ncbi:CsgG/HfaB family protein [Odoribacter lunatus]|uniref:CsgG/HfaB family protein n=1 Tax=Odoribacter lunatus TaxID=2941335 RepID=UPI00203F236B|nr:CsgG/HfaB family protein [Odoribacter lunatus]
MKRFSLIVAMLCLFGVAMAQQAVKQKVAVYVTGDAENGYKKVIGSKLVTGITRSENYAAVERTADFLGELTKEQDYQMSGAVSDNQIARLGQQFGVRYVLVADVSELFESMFISARMIDVQTAQIVNSAETSGSVSGIESLTKLAENIILEIITPTLIIGGTSTSIEEAVKQLPNMYNFRELVEYGYYRISVPEGYHIATKDEIVDIIKKYQIIGKKLSFPIYTNISKSSNFKNQRFVVNYYNRYDKFIKSETKYKVYREYKLTCVCIKNEQESIILNLSCIDDSEHAYHYSNNNKPFRAGYYKLVTEGLTDLQTPIPQMSSGYIYVVKDKK